MPFGFVASVGQRLLLRNQWTGVMLEMGTRDDFGAQTRGPISVLHPKSLISLRRLFQSSISREEMSFNAVIARFTMKVVEFHESQSPFQKSIVVKMFRF
jgi:hypothetical protein